MNYETTEIRQQKYPLESIMKKKIFENRLPALVNLTQPLGAGGYAKVYKGYLTRERISDGQVQTIPIAVKRTILKDVGRNYIVPQQREKLIKLVKKEIAILERAVHPNIVGYYGCYEQPDYFDIYLELCDCSLREFLCDKISEIHALKLFNQIFQATLFLRSLNLKKDGKNCEKDFIGIYHRDLNLRNTLLLKGQVKITDFGLSQTNPDNNQDPTYRRGTPLYMSPENFNSSKYDLEKNDVWSMGVILYQFLYGYNSYNARDAQTYQLIYPQTISQELISLLKHMMCKESERYTFDQLKYESVLLKYNNIMEEHSTSYQILLLNNKVEIYQNVLNKLKCLNNLKLQDEIENYVINQQAIWITNKYQSFGKKFVYQSTNIMELSYKINRHFEEVIQHQFDTCYSLQTERLDYLILVKQLQLYRKQNRNLQNEIQAVYQSLMEFVNWEQIKQLVKSQSLQELENTLATSFGKQNIQ